MYSFYSLPPIDLISRPQASNQLNLALLRSEILHIKTEHKWK